MDDKFLAGKAARVVAMDRVRLADTGESRNVDLGRWLVPGAPSYLKAGYELGRYDANLAKVSYDFGRPHRCTYRGVP